MFEYYLFIIFFGVVPFYAVICPLFGPKPLRYAELSKFCSKLPFTLIVPNFVTRVKITVRHRPILFFRTGQYLEPMLLGYSLKYQFDSSPLVFSSHCFRSISNNSSFYTTYRSPIICRCLFYSPPLDNDFLFLTLSLSGLSL